jgi:hypothetical protein
VIGRASRCILLACAIAASTGCADDTALEGTPVELSVGGQTVALQMGDCRVYKVTRNFFGSVRKTRVLSGDFYLGFTACTRQSLSKSGDYAIASLCRQAIGAGGGCAVSGTFRSKDGDNWEKSEGNGRWIRVESP